MHGQVILDAAETVDALGLAVDEDAQPDALAFSPMTTWPSSHMTRNTRPRTTEPHVTLLTSSDNLAAEAVLLARAIAAQGQTRYGEASQLIAISQKAAVGEGLVTQIIGRGWSARMLVDCSRHAEAAELASSAASGRLSEAQAAVTQAFDLYRRKGDLPGARESSAISSGTHTF
jgi:hypothetical protein